jgi:2-keto-4-pentenoate hydratase
MGAAPCGVRLVLPREAGAPAVAGPVLEGRLLPQHTKLALAALRHARATAAIVAVLAEDLPAEAGAMPTLSALHPAIDVAASRFRDAPSDPALLSADLGGLGLIVLGRRAPAMPAVRNGLPASLSVARRRSRPETVDADEGMRRAADAARRLGGTLPAGSILILAGLTPAITPAPGSTMVARLGPIGRATAEFL